MQLVQICRKKNAADLRLEASFYITETRCMEPSAYRRNKEELKLLFLQKQWKLNGFDEETC